MRASMPALALALLVASPAWAEPAAKGSLPPLKVVDKIGDAGSSPALNVPAATPTRHLRVTRHAHRSAGGRHLERPALAGVVLSGPVPGPFKEPRPAVFAPAYLFDTIASDLTTPPPPLVCERARRDRTVPDPHLYREVWLACGYDVN